MLPMTDSVSCVCRYIDQGRNPQLYTKECLERALARNEQVKGKIDTMTVSDRIRVTEVLSWGQSQESCSCFTDSFFFFF